MELDSEPSVLKIGQVVVAILLMALSLKAGAQGVSAVRTTAPERTPSTEGLTVGPSAAEPTLPEAPAPVEPSGDGQSQASGANPLARSRQTSTFDRYIDPSEIAPRLSIGDKILTGMRASVSDLAIAGWIGASVYEQAFDRGPNYGQTPKGFVQRLGAAAARDTSESIFTDSVFSPIYHTDPRYYELGPGHGTVHRAAYAVSRVFIVRTDGGAQTVNFALLSGNLAGAALTQLYYPGRNRSPSQVFETFSTSLGGSALGYLIGEFFAHKLQAELHLRGE